MRDFKFRAWDKVNKKWLLGYDIGNLGGFSLTGECVIMGEFAALFQPLSRLNDIEIMQFTGLKDKNGKEIFEGDILYGQTGYGRNKLAVEYHAPKWMFRRIGLTKEQGIINEFNCLVDIGSGNAQNFEDYYRLEFLEIIGNVHESPELLEQTKERE